MANAAQLPHKSRQVIQRGCAIAALALLFASTVAAEEIAWQFDGWEGPSFPVRIFKPDDAGPATRIMVVMHGNSRDVERYYSDWKALGEKLSLIVVVPEFSRRDFKGSARYNLGHVFEPGSRKQRPKELWTFSAIEAMFDEAVRRVGGAQKTYMIYGHSAGSQFVHRYLYYVPDARVSQYFAANAGWYTLPVADFDYPYGLSKSGLDDSNVAAIFTKPLVIMLGSEDTDESEASLRKTREANKQGSNRLARGLTMYRISKKRAEELGLEFNWQLLVVKGADHDNAKMAPAAAAIAVR